MNCYTRNELIRYPNFMYHKLYHQKQHQYLQWTVLNISTKYQVVLRTPLSRSVVTAYYQVGWINCTL